MEIDVQRVTAAGPYQFRPHRLSDLNVESSYEGIAKAFRLATDLTLDFRQTTWFDLWALIQLLFLLRERNETQKNWSVILLSPGALPKNATSDRLRQAVEVLQFLFNIGFLKEIEALGGSIYLQERSSYDSAVPASSSDIAHAVTSYSNAGVDNGDGRAILPITHLSSLDLKTIRDQLYAAADKLFGQYRAETIVHRGGIGDCLLTELVNNARFHGGGNAYVALRAVPGLRRFRRSDPKEYRLLHNLRTRHPLGDWRRYFQANPDDPYFELVVADRGAGIAQTILEDERLPRALRAGPPSPDTTHRLVAYALQSESSRLSRDERQRHGLTDFTGLAAVRFVLGENQGTLIIREPKTRHWFGGNDALLEGTLVNQIDLKPSPHPLAQIKGTSLNVVVPIRSARAEPFGVLLQLSSPVLPAAEAIPPMILRVVGDDAEPETYLDRSTGTNWRKAAEDIDLLEGTGKLVAIDLSAAPHTKDALWKGLRSTLKLAVQHHLPVVLVGVTPRLASRLEEFISLDKGGLSGDWLLLGCGDDSIGYAFGRVGHTPAERRRALESTLAAFARGHQPPSEVTSALRATNSIKLDSDSPYSRAVPSWTFGEVIGAIVAHYGQNLATGLKTTSAWLPGTIARLPNDDVIADYFCIHSLAQLRDFREDFARLACLLSAWSQFDGILALGVSADEVASRLATRLTVNRLRRGAPPLRMHAAQDSFALDHGETGASPLERTNNLVLLDAIRTGNHASEAVSHIRDTGGHVAALIALLDFREDNGKQDLEGTPLLSVVRIPIQRLEPTAIPDFYESPYSGSLERLTSSTGELPAFLTRRQAYQYLEAHGLIASGHLTFYDQHFARTVPLAYILSSSIGITAVQIVRD